MSLKYEFEKVYAELPAWMADATISKCSVDRRDSIISKLIRYVVEPYIIKHKDDLARGEKGTIDANPLVEAAMRGWKELPIRPLSRQEMERALVGIRGSRLIAGTSVKLSYVPKDGAKLIIIELVEKPPPPPPPPPQVNAMEIWEIGNVIISIGLLRKDRLGYNVKAIDITIETEDECGFHITNASLEDLEWIIGEDPLNAFVNRISPVSPEVKFAKLRIELSTPMEKQKVEKLIINLGISEGGFNLTG